MAGIPALLGPGMLVQPFELLDELALLARAGVDPAQVRVSSTATIVLPHHVDEDIASDKRRGLGTTRSGIGPALADKARRIALRVQDLTDAARVRQALEARVPRQRRAELEASARSIVRCGRKLAPRVVDGGAMVRAALDRGDHVLCEGAQGVLLDVDHGTWPYVTGTHPTVSGALAALGIPPRAAGRVIGVTRAYCTRQGPGAFPTEVRGHDEGALRAATHEYSMRIGWLDLHALRFAHALNGFDELVVTGLDRLRGLSTVRVGDGWTDARGRPTDSLCTRPAVRARLRDLPGFLLDVSGARTASALPSAARAFLDDVERSVSVPVLRFSVGRDGPLATRRSSLLRR
ncbi:MAG: adenylosuccinate synthetase [Deltaproteobacteria bacterium]|nr:adenylosuccinate synthetase [Deltaproteobacteria bacterium]